MPFMVKNFMFRVNVVLFAVEDAVDIASFNNEIENTRLVLNIAQVYPARLRRYTTTRLAE